MDKYIYRWPCCCCFKLIHGMCFARRGVCWKRELVEYLDRKGWL